MDFQVSKADSIHVNLGFTRSWFQTPNAFDNLNATAWYGVLVVNDGLGPGYSGGSTDQRSQIKTFNIAPSWTRLLNTTRSLPSAPSYGATSTTIIPAPIHFPISAPIQQRNRKPGSDADQHRRASDISWVKGIHNFKAGATYQQTFLDEKNIGVVDPRFAPCLATGTRCGRQPRTQNPDDHHRRHSRRMPIVNSLGCLPLSAALTVARAAPFNFHGHTDVKQLALYAQDTITKGHGRSASGCAAISITDLRLIAKPNLAWVSLTT